VLLKHQATVDIDSHRALQLHVDLNFGRLAPTTSCALCVAMPADSNPFDEFKDDSGTSSGEDEKPQPKLPPIKVVIPIFQYIYKLISTIYAYLSYIVQICS
jgi:hypothetical protein